jgi:FAD/FMN-containing dehydrogenase
VVARQAEDGFTMMASMTFREGIVRRGAAGYEELRRRLVRNSLLPARYPEVIVRAQTIDEAVAAVRLARELGLQLATRSGGHSWCAAALRDDSLLLDLSRLNDLRIDPDGRRMTVGPGLTNGGLTSALAGHDLGFPAGHCRDVGLGGYLLTGGLGWNAGTWGPACHSVAAVEVITAQGDVVVADDRHNPDLLWAARGAGPGFFAVATSFEARLYEAPRFTLTSSFAFPLPALADVAAWVARLADGLDRRLELSLAFASAPASLAALGIEAGRPIVVVTAVAFADSREECDSLLAPLEEGIGRRGFLESETRRETPQQALYELTGARLPAGRQFAADCLWSDEEPLAVFEALGAALLAAPSASSWMLVNVASAQPPLVSPAPSAFSVSGKLYVSIYAVWDDGSAAARNLAWLRETMRGLESLAAGSYVGEADLVARPSSAAQSFSPAAWRRLNDLRDKHDPERLFCWYPGLA